MVDDSVEVGADGRLRGSGAQVVARLQQRTGQYDVLPTAADTLTLRRVGGEPTAALWFSGEIDEHGPLWDLLGVAAHAHWCGRLVVVGADDGVRRELILQQGCVVAARAGRSPRGAATGEPSGEDAPVATEQQLEAAFYALLAVTRGTFFFEEAATDAVARGRVQLDMASLLMAGLDRLDVLRPAPESIEGRAGAAALPSMKDVVSRYNRALALVIQVLNEHAPGEDISTPLATFAQDNETLRALSAARLNDGTMVLDVAPHLKRASLSVKQLSRALNEAANFAVFVAESSLLAADPAGGRETAARLSRAVAELTAALAP
ncbi:MAG TPA: DUF4388 domain-containing protein [Sorangium sp.]|nr:DUF4388 domain-containing protein [Sorangium sp.]